MSFFKKLLGLGAAATITAGAAAQEAPKVDKLTTETTKTISYETPSKKVESAIDYTKAVESMAERKKVSQELDSAKAGLLKANLDFEASFAQLLKSHEHDKVATELLLKAADYPQEIQRYLKGFLELRTRDTEALKDPTFRENLINEAIKFIENSRNPITGDEYGPLTKVLEETLSGSLTEEAAHIGDSKIKTTTGNSDQAKKFTSWKGQDNITDRMISNSVLIYILTKLHHEETTAADAAATASESTSINNTPLASK